MIKKLLYGFVLLVTSETAWSATCFKDHLIEAVHINKIRLPLYSQQTNGHSEWMSRAWIASEQAVLNTLNIFNPDSFALKYEQAGIPIICSGFMPMNQTPDFNYQKLSPPPLPFKSVQYTKNLRTRLKVLLDQNNFYKGWQLLDSEIKKLETQPNYHCLSRHILESSARFLSQAESFNQHALRIGLESSLPISKKMALWQLLGLPFTKLIDTHAAKIQAQGVPIFCNDIPKIPYDYKI